MKQKYSIEQIKPDVAKSLCGEIIANLPEYFGLPDANKFYIKGVCERINLAARIEDQYVGLLSLEFPYPNNGNIFWMGIYPEWQNKGIGHLLIDEAACYSKKLKANTMTVETLSLDEADENYSKTYHFYEKSGFKPLFNLKPEGYLWKMVYMLKNL